MLQPEEAQSLWGLFGDEGLRDKSHGQKQGQICSLAINTETK